jgi:hypothetical protein
LPQRNTVSCAGAVSEEKAISHPQNEKRVHVEVMFYPASLINFSSSTLGWMLGFHDKERPMSRMRLLRAISTHALILLGLLAVAPGGVFAQGDSIEMPQNAHAKSYGGGWECDRDYRKINETCAAVEIPANAYSTNASYGRGWECGRGYRKSVEACVPINVPANAYLNASGDTWKCNRGYRAVDEACLIVKVPENAYLVDSSYGLGWACGRGYRAVNNFCVGVTMPENAHLDYSGNDWDCNRPYQKQQDRCALP